ncbi:MAG TPA: ice-binding family protein [Patescibacteria group bacterium]|jgi:type VI secretion system secreted protein VgrG|nr:ice-binding family protein [Patescibacteria group bacterium]
MTKSYKVRFLIPIFSWILFVSVLTPVKVFAATSPSLGSADSYSILAGSEVTNVGVTSISGDVGISPGIGAAPHYSGFGTVTLGGTIHDADANALQAQADKGVAFAALLAQGCDTDYGAVTTELAGMNLIPGVYCSTSFHLSSGVLTLSGTSADVWIFKSASDIIITGGIASEVVFSGGGLACNVWWTAVSSTTFDAGSSLVGNILADTSITLAAGASLEGRALARTAAVTLSGNSITSPNCTAPSSGGGGGSSGSRRRVVTPTFPPNLVYVAPSPELLSPQPLANVPKLPITGITLNYDVIAVFVLLGSVLGFIMFFSLRRKKAI